LAQLSPSFLSLFPNISLRKGVWRRVLPLEDKLSFSLYKCLNQGLIQGYDFDFKLGKAAYDFESVC
jgi:hypothetical protein